MFLIRCDNLIIPIRRTPPTRAPMSFPLKSRRDELIFQHHAGGFLKLFCWLFLRGRDEKKNSLFGKGFTLPSSSSARDIICVLNTPDFLPMPFLTKGPEWGCPWCRRVVKPEDNGSLRSTKSRSSNLLQLSGPPARSGWPDIPLSYPCWEHDGWMSSGWLINVPDLGIEDPPGWAEVFFHPFLCPSK